MKIESLAIKTDLIFARFNGQIYDRNSYIVIKTPARPSYFWGNYIFMPGAPSETSLQEWLQIYRSEFDSDRQGFVTFALDAPDGHVGHVQPFLDFGFRCNINKVLTTQSVNAPPKFNHHIQVRPIKLESEWEQLVDVHYSESWYLNPDSQIPFLRSKLSDLRRMCDAGLGHRFGAFLDDRLVGDLGIYKDGKLGRFNEVATHRHFRRQGICGTLVYQSARHALEALGIKTLVMEADEDYHAAAIYESVGFNPTQRQVGLEWFDPAIHG